MGDGIQKKYAIIVNGDTEARHLGNVDRAIAALKAEASYEISVLSPSAPKDGSVSHQSPDRKNLQSQIDGLKTKLDDDDLLVVYVTGHGGKGVGDESFLDLPKDPYAMSAFKKDLEGISYGKRIVVMDTCYSGGGLSLFANPKTSVITAGSPGEIVNCQAFSPFFWSDKVPDVDGDGRTSLQERYQFTAEQAIGQSLAQFFNPEPISFSGSATAGPFRTPDQKPIVVHGKKDLEAQLKRLKPGQLALVKFSADWCGPCQKYQPRFEELTKEYDGRFLTIVAEGVGGSEEDWAKYGVSRFPTVAFIDHRGRVSPVADREDPIASLSFASVYDKKQRLPLQIRQILKAGPYKVLGTERGLQLADNSLSSYFALSRLGLNGRQMAEQLLPILKSDPDSRTTQLAKSVFNILLIENPSVRPMVQDQFIRWLRTADRDEFCKLFNRMPEDFKIWLPHKLPKILDWLKGADAEQQATLLRYINSYAAADPSLLLRIRKGLQPWLDTPHTETRLRVAETLLMLKEKPENILPILSEVLDDPAENDDRIVQALKVLMPLKEQSAACFFEVLGVLQRSEGVAQVRAVEALVKMGPAGKWALPFILTLPELKSNFFRRGEVRSALEKFFPDSEWTVQILVGMFGFKEEYFPDYEGDRRPLSSLYRGFPSIAPGIGMDFGLGSLINPKSNL